VDIGLARNADRHRLVSDGDGACVPVMALENDRISGRNYHVKYVHIIFVMGEVVVRLLVHGNDSRSLGKK